MTCKCLSLGTDTMCRRSSDEQLMGKSAGRSDV
jgi:hypothetical protein